MPNTVFSRSFYIAAKIVIMQDILLTREIYPWTIARIRNAAWPEEIVFCGRICFCRITGGSRIITRIGSSLRMYRTVIVY